jgi:hypothetical protein
MLAEEQPKLDIEIMLLEQKMSRKEFRHAIIKPLRDIDEELNPENMEDGQVRVINLKFFLGNKTFPYRGSPQSKRAASIISVSMAPESETDSHS